MHTHIVYPTHMELSNFVDTNTLPLTITGRFVVLGLLDKHHRPSCLYLWCWRIFYVIYEPLHVFTLSDILAANIGYFAQRSIEVDMSPIQAL